MPELFCAFAAEGGNILSSIAARRQFITLPRASPSRTWRAAARITHIALYAALLILPVTGYIKLAATGFQVNLFGFATLPVLPFSPKLAQSAATWHAWALPYFVS